MIKKSEKQKRVIGDIVRVDLGDGFHTYARVLEESVTFYDCRVDQDLPLGRILSSRALFSVWVMDYAIKSGRWKIIGQAPLDASLATPHRFFMQDAIRHDEFSIYESGNIRRASRNECVGLERAAAWDPEHVEDRIRDHHSGRPNKWVESLKIDS